MPNIYESTDPKLVKIAKLLKLAERATTEEESVAFMDKAQALSATYSIDLAIARQHTDKTERRRQMVQRDVVIGARGAKFNKGLIVLMVCIANAYTVKIDIGGANDKVYLYGYEADLDLIEAMYASVAVQMVEAGNRYLASGEYKSQTVWSESKCDYVPMHGTTARVAFNAGFAHRIGKRLELQTARAREAYLDSRSLPEAEAQTVDPISQSAAVAIRATELELTEFYKEQSRAKGSWKGSSFRKGAAYESGREAGNRARLSGTTAIGGHRTSLAGAR